jgi:hypothetical protein
VRRRRAQLADWANRCRGGPTKVSEERSSMTSAEGTECDDGAGTVRLQAPRVNDKRSRRRAAAVHEQDPAAVSAAIEHVSEVLPIL